MTLPFPPPSPAARGDRSTQPNKYLPQVAGAVLVVLLLAVAIWIYMRGVTPARLVFLGNARNGEAAAEGSEDGASSVNGAVAEGETSGDAPCKRSNAGTDVPTVEITSTDPVKLRVATCNVNDERIHASLKYSTEADTPATVSKRGQVTCNASGTTVVIARVANGESDAPEIEIPVRCTLVAGLRLNLPSPRVYVGSTPQPFRVDALGADGLPVAHANVRLEISDTSIVEVTAGLLVPKKAGIVTIIAQIGNHAASYQVDVVERLLVSVTVTNEFTSNGQNRPWDPGWGGEPDVMVKLNEQALGMESAPSDTVCDDDRTCRFFVDTPEPDGHMQLEIMDEDPISVQRIANLSCQLNGRESTTCGNEYASVTIERAKP